MTDGATWIDRVVQARQAGRPLALAFAYDGALVPDAPRPELAVLPEASRRLLRRLADGPGVRVGVVSGRSLASLRRLVGLPGVDYAGTSGLELEVRGVRVAHPESAAGQRLIGVVEPAIRALCRDFPGAWVESKPLGLTLHHRDLAGARVSELRDAARAAVAADDIGIAETAAAVELTPRLGWSKGTAVRAIAADAGPDALLLYAGAEASDVEALQVAECLGVAVGVGPAAPAAAYRAAGPDEFTAALRDLADLVCVPTGWRVVGSWPDGLAHPRPANGRGAGESI